MIVKRHLCFAPEKTGWRTTVNDVGMRSASWLAVFLNRMLGSRSQDRLGILTYHRVAAHVPGLPPPAHNVTPVRFREQLQGLLRRGYSVWPLQRVLEYHENNQPLPPKTIVVTFDDGFESVYLNAWPVLRQLKIPATIFVNTAYLDSDNPFPFDSWGVAQEKRAPKQSYRPLTSEQCQEMLDSGLIELGAHTHTHEDFRGRPDAFQEDLQVCMDILHDRFGLSRMTFAFPYGSPYHGFVSEELVEAARKTGVRCSLTTECVLVDLATDPFWWGRINAFSWDTSATLAAKLSGWYSWAPRVRQKVALMLRKSSLFSVLLTCGERSEELIATGI